MRRLVFPLGLLAAALLIQILAGLNPQLTEHYYSRKLFPLVARSFGFAGVADFSLAELLLALLVAGLLPWFGLQGWLLFSRRTTARALALEAVRKALWLAGLSWLLFMLAFGLNYQRRPLADNLALTLRDPNVTEAEAISRVIVTGINLHYVQSLAGGAKAAGPDGSRMPLTRVELHAVIEEAFEREPLLRDFSFGDGLAPPKPVYLSGLLSRLGVSGIYSPFTGEPNYNASMPDSALPFTIAHEMAHQRGFAREDEANFVAFLVCTGSAHPYVRYSGHIGALRVLGVLFRLSPERYREVWASLEAGPREDLKARAAFWARYSGRLSDLSRQLNHTYLKANGVRSGVRNYDESVRLIVAYYLSRPRLLAGSLFAD